MMDVKVDKYGKPEDRVPMPLEIDEGVLAMALSDIADFRGSNKEAIQVFREFYKAAISNQHRIDNPGPNDIVQKAFYVLT